MPSVAVDDRFEAPSGLPTPLDLADVCLARALAALLEACELAPETLPALLAEDVRSVDVLVQPHLDEPPAARSEAAAVSTVLAAGVIAARDDLVASQQATPAHAREAVLAAARSLTSPTALAVEKAATALAARARALSSEPSAERPEHTYLLPADFPPDLVGS